MTRLLAGVLYSVQIFCDFSGYSDMAIAVAALFGYRLTKNFDAPYFSTNIQEFWQRWHISLSTWLRDYLYIPLGGNRGTAQFVARNLFLTMLLGGLWHGANWTFILWGALHGFALVVHRFLWPRTTDTSAPVHRLASWALTLAWVMFCFTIFRTPDIGVAWNYFTAPASRNALQLSIAWWPIILALGSLQFWVYRNAASLRERARSLPGPTFFAALGLVCAVLLYLTPANMAPFIYFQF